MRHDPLPGQLATVRLLTPAPRIDGLAAPLPPSRMRRATELIAYVAVQDPHPVPGGRLRARVLGSADDDASAKTLFNTASAARRALGLSSAGTPLMPRASAEGWYVVAPEISSDVAELESLCATAGQEGDPALRTGQHLRAIGLIEGEPLSSVRRGYEWWITEGHEARVAALVVDTACQLAADATLLGAPHVAIDALERARLVDPYSEALTRSAIRLWAAAGDIDRVRREWQACLRRSRELDLGGKPSVKTTEVFRAAIDHEITRGWAGVRAVVRPQVDLAYASLAAIESAARRTEPSAPAAL